MGLTAVRELTEIEEIQTEALRGTTVAVDAHNWLYKYMMPVVQYTDTETYTTTEGVELPAVLGLLKGLRRFYEHDITPVFVYDGGAHTLKTDEIARRKSKKEAAAEVAEAERAAGNPIAAARAEAKSTLLTKEMITATQDVLDALSLSIVEAPLAGEAQAAHMTTESDVYTATISDDYDALLFGASCVVRNFTSSPPHERIYLQSLQQNPSLSQRQLIWFALLCGTDYNDGARGYGPVRSLEAVQEASEEELRSIVLENDDGLTHEELAAIQELFLSPEVSAYPEPTSLHPVIETRVVDTIYDDWSLRTEAVATEVNRLLDCVPTPD